MGGRRHGAARGVPKYRGSSLPRYGVAFGTFLLAAGAAIARLHQRRRLAVVQVYSMPETLMVAGLVPRLRGVPLVYLAGDLTTELYATKFGDGGVPLVAGVLGLQERTGLRLADLFITVHEEYRRRVLARGVPADRVVVVMNLPDERLFHAGVREAVLRERAASGAAGRADEFTVVFHGSLVERYGPDLAVEAVARLRDRIPGLRLCLYGDGDLRPRLVALIERLDLKDRVYLSPGYVAVEAIPQSVAGADLGIVPTRSDPFTETIIPTKLLEYLALGVPAVATSTRTTVANVPPDLVEYCAPGDVDALAGAIERLWADPARRQALAAAGLAWSAEHSWEREAAKYCAAIDALATA